MIVQCLPPPPPVKKSFFLGEGRDVHWLHCDSYCSVTKSVVFKKLRHGFRILKSIVQFFFFNSSFVIRANLFHSWPPSLLSLCFFSILANYHFQVFFNLKVILYVAKLPLPGFRILGLTGNYKSIESAVWTCNSIGCLFCNDLFDKRLSLNTCVYEQANEMRRHSKCTSYGRFRITK